MTETTSPPLAGCLVRLLWLIIGNLVLLLNAAAIYYHQAGFSLTVRDLVFWLLVLALLVLRVFDICCLGGKTGDNRPATLADWRRYAMGLLLVSFGLWLAAHWLS